MKLQDGLPANRRLPANRFGRPFRYAKEKVSNLSQLNAADHIVYEGPLNTYWHHMIVESIDEDKKEINVIHYYGTYSGVSVCWKNTPVSRDALPFASHTFYRIVYHEKVKCLSPSEVLAKAIERLGEEKYNPISNNCEHFATECKTGEPKSLQIWTLLEIITKGGFVGFFTSANNFRAAKAAVEKGSRSGRSAVQSIPKTAVAVGTVIEAYLMWNDISNTLQRKNEGMISEAECHDVVVKRVASGICSVPTSICGAAIGQILIPIPYVGAIIGGVVGDYAGKLVGGIIGDALSPIFVKAKNS